MFTWTINGFNPKKSLINKIILINKLKKILNIRFVNSSLERLSSTEFGKAKTMGTKVPSASSCNAWPYLQRMRASKSIRLVWTKARKMFAPIILLISFSYVNANLEGPFLFFGPKSLEKFKKPALKFLDQDDLMKIYAEPSAIVVFNNQDSLTLSSGNFPRLRKMLEGQSLLVLPQDFLDVHPDYISNETQVSTSYYTT